MNFKQKILISMIGFIVVFWFLNRNSALLDIFKSYDELFYENYLPIEMKNEKFLGQIADSSNHMSPYLRFEKTCLPELDQWQNKFKPGDLVSKKKNDTTLIVKNADSEYEVKFDSKNFTSSPLPCDCSEILGEK